MLAEVLARQLQEDLAVRAQRRAGDGVEARAQPLDGLVERRLPLALDLLVGLDLRPQDRELEVQRLALAPAAPGRSEDADQHADDQADERRDEDGQSLTASLPAVDRTPQMHHVVHVDVRRSGAPTFCNGS